MSINAHFSLFTQRPCWLFCSCTASVLLWRMCRDTGGDTGGPPNVSFNHQTPNAPFIRTQWGLKEECGCVTGWPWLTGISCVWHVVLKGRDLFLLFFSLFLFRWLIRLVKDIYYEPLNPSLDLTRRNCFTAKIVRCTVCRPGQTFEICHWKFSPRHFLQTFRVNEYSNHFFWHFPHDKKRQCTSLTSNICIISLSSMCHRTCPCHLPLLQLRSRLGTKKPQNICPWNFKTLWLI